MHTSWKGRSWSVSCGGCCPRTASFLSLVLMQMLASKSRTAQIHITTAKAEE